MSSDDHSVPSDDRGFISRYVFSTDHKVIAKQYLSLSLFWALIGGGSAYLIRWQIAHPDTEAFGWGYIEPNVYNALVTMHGTIMVFFVAMPLLLAVFGNFLIPLMVGARDMAFPRLNMLSVWIFTLASLVLFASMFVPGGAAAAGWTGYPPLSAKNEYTGGGYGMDLWLLSLALEFASFLLGGINFLTTAINMRAPGMTLMRLPMVVWMQLIAAVVFMLSVGPTIAGAILLLLDRNLGTTFYAPDAGGDPLLWQHLFWFFGHPEVYVILLPGLGITLEIITVFARKPVFAYRPIIYASIIAGFLGFVVWAHHQYVSGMDPRLAMPFSITTILISVPFGLVIFSIIATLWGAIDDFCDANAVCRRHAGRFYFRRADGNLQRIRRSGYLHPRHLLRRRPLSLYADQQRFLRRLRRPLFLVPEDVRPPHERDLGKNPFLAHVYFLQFDLWPHASRRGRRHDAAHRRSDAVRFLKAGGAAEYLYYAHGDLAHCVASHICH